MSKTQTWIAGTLVSVALGVALALAGSQGGAEAGGIAVFAFALGTITKAVLLSVPTLSSGVPPASGM